MAVEIDEGFLWATLSRLVQIESINPSLVPGGSGESSIAEYTANVLSAIGLEVFVLESISGRPSVVGLLPGRGGRSLMLNAHYDTVGAADMDDPFSGSMRQGRLYGRGAYDMKGGLAASIAAAKAIVDAKLSLEGDLIIAAVADEEYASIGTSEVIEQFSVDGAIVTEPTQLQICIAHKGFVWLSVDVYGLAAHGSKFDIGLDANMRMGRFLSELEGLEASLRSQVGHRLVGPPSLHAATLTGGSELSAYAAHCRLQVERRTIPGETAARAVAELQDIIDRLAAVDETFSAEVKPIFVRQPFEANPESIILQVLTRTAKEVTGQEPNWIGETAWMDSALLGEAGIDTVVMGAGGGGAHAREEWVDLPSVVTLAQILAETAVKYGHK